MADYSGYFGDGESKYLKGKDIAGRIVKVQIESSHVDEFDDFKDKTKKNKKPVVKFVNKEKMLILNFSSFEAIAEAFGQDSEEWVGKEIELFTTKMNIGGEAKDVIQVRAGQSIEDDIPF